MKEYFYEIATNINNQSYLNNISFSTLLDMSLVNINNIEDKLVLGSDCKAEDEAHLDILRTVCLLVLRTQNMSCFVTRSLHWWRRILAAANITWRPEENLYLKVRL